MDCEEISELIDSRIAGSLGRIVTDLQALHSPEVATNIERILHEEIRWLMS